MRTLLVLTALLVPSIASADVVGPDDPSVVCPAGSVRVTHHCGTVCEPRPCDGDADCAAGLRCVDVRLCIATEPYCGRGSIPYDRVYGDCSTRMCAAGSCQTIGACGAAPTDSGPAPTDSGTTPSDGGGSVFSTYGCGCRTSAGRGGAGWVLALALLLMARRPRRSSSRRG